MSGTGDGDLFSLYYLTMVMEKAFSMDREENKVSFTLGLGVPPNTQEDFPWRKLGRCLEAQRRDRVQELKI